MWAVSEWFRWSKASYHTPTPTPNLYPAPPTPSSLPGSGLEGDRGREYGMYIDIEYAVRKKPSKNVIPDLWEN